VPLPCPFLSFGVAVIATPLLGLDEATVSVYVAANAVGTAKTQTMATILIKDKVFLIIILPPI
jgi:hypothetical protein